MSGFGGWNREQVEAAYGHLIVRLRQSLTGAADWGLFPIPRRDADGDYLYLRLDSRGWDFCPEDVRSSSRT